MIRTFLGEVLLVVIAAFILHDVGAPALGMLFGGVGGRWISRLADLRGPWLPALGMLAGTLAGTAV
jgi:hypothetical protein